MGHISHLRKQFILLKNTTIIYFMKIEWFFNRTYLSPHYPMMLWKFEEVHNNFNDDNSVDGQRTDFDKKTENKNPNSLNLMLKPKLILIQSHEAWVWF